MAATTADGMRPQGLPPAAEITAPGRLPDAPGALVCVLTGGAAGDAERTAEAGPTVESVIARWRAARAARRVILAAPRSFCAGVDRAIEIVERALALHRAPVYVRKQIVHNRHVVADLAARGAVFVDELDEVPPGAVTVFSAHGVSPAVRAAAAERDLRVIDATCPLVTKVHSEVRRFAGRGDTVVLIGHAGHEEVEGTLGEAPERTVLVENLQDVARLDVPDGARVSYLMQTTLAADEAADVVAALSDRFPEVTGPDSDDICYASTNRQRAVVELARLADLVLVIGSANSSNSVRLVELAERLGTQARLIDGASEIDLDWLDGRHVVGVTAGASAPEARVEEVIEHLAELGPVSRSEVRVAVETVDFLLPKELRGTDVPHEPESEAPHEHR
ncbi:4-hydroxy-3-methylbut-2-enyl diphosphate reductase [Streptomyces broussonetiae]|uniref:4-hydroxy-3-methylbut-2-enyl diphosphate reductase n=2 Tax=Streptomyces broussonetiae TaxID=2686304 RepID=A0A6I6NEY2_9ACTN|nr:4-hydroxy-3-methylbut-2-enyl diphosphate reductase [Streptomyces broussonetiae]